MELAGCQLLYPLCKHSVMWFFHVIKQIFTFIRLLNEAQEFFRQGTARCHRGHRLSGLSLETRPARQGRGYPGGLLRATANLAAQWRVKKCAG